ncbi:glutamate ABC transporter substrate-binding protein [Streptomyces griseoviridis]|uniref:Glutamate transport system substrate-binding protein n=1 Tax=Streptomyces griseoviridis TaxID=45398 RepID=A0ABT9LNH2_STRGD|nr:glutamate ABC transporter substrate-binding protein [Streptomyces griseoviridis]MDP9685080.1 glutamate transport system substrate-binding protein [Streptomyces griseoviridis]GGT14895.1 amino acid-binding protein [Streptomyces griseoviridis]
MLSTVRGRRRAPLAAAAAAAALVLASACSGSSDTVVPGAPAAAGKKADTSAIDRLIADEKPASASLMPAGSTAAKIKEAGTLVVGGTQTAALFSQLDPTTGKVEGFDAALSRLLAKYIIGKPDTKLVNVTAATREALLKNHSVDAVIATYTITDERAKAVNFAGPYYVDGLGIQLREDQKGIASLDDLKGRTVTTQSGSTAAAVVEERVPSAKIQLFDTNTECLQALRQGRADAYVLDQGVLAGNAGTHPDVKVVAGTYGEQPYGIGLPLDRPDFKTFVNDWLRKIEADGTWATLWKNTIGTQVPGPVPTPPAIG